jgi:hypothetical protein
MGNFYANIALRTSDIDRVERTLTELDRDAFVATDGRLTMVFDRECDNQDVSALEGLSVALSKSLGCSALAACNHDDDALLLLSVDSGQLVDRYDSTPGYFGRRRRDPEGGDAVWLCRAFGSGGGASDCEKQVTDVLRTPHAEIGFEVDRHRSLQGLLELPETMSFLGYRYVARGELAADPAAGTLRKLGKAASEESRGSPVKNSVGREQADALVALQNAEPDLFWNAYALALGEAKVAQRFVPLFGVAEGNGQVLFRRVRDYILSRGLVAPGGQIHADDLLAEFLGVREFPQLALTRLLREALEMPPMSADQIAAFGRNDPELLLRVARGFEAVERDANPSAFAEPTDDAE